MATILNEFANTLPGLDQYAVRKFASALEIFPKTLAENSGVNTTEVLRLLHASHGQGQNHIGFDINDELGNVINVNESKIFDLYVTKMWALKYAVEAACTVLRVDQIIMAKRAGGPKPPKQNMGDQDED